jgi:[acyl-carrier-protein] S-malonyltransferase
MFAFPGQGSQYRGMGEDVYEAFSSARRVYEQASEALGFDLAELSIRDPQQRLDLTAYTQPALLTHSVACMEAFRELTEGKLSPAIAAGHSLGEYTALVAAGVLDFGQALRLVHRRGQLMSEHGAGQMVAVPLPVETVRPYAERHYCGIGGCNLPNQTVVGGPEEDLDALAEELRRSHPNARVTRLRTEGAFHTYLMVEAARRFRAALEETTFQAPSCRVLSNFTGDFHDAEPEGIRYRLFFQLFHPVRWVWGLQRALEAKISVIVEFGGGLGSGGPADRRPNLGTVIKRTVKARSGRFGRRSEDVRTLDGEALYEPAINVATIRSAAHLALAMSKASSAEDAEHGATQGAQLFIPTRGGIPLASGAELARRIEIMGLADRIGLILQDEVENASILQKLVGDEQPAAPYLATSTGAEGGTRYATGPDIDDDLERLRSETSA